MQIDIDGKMLGIRYPMDINLQGDSKETLKALIPLLKEKKTEAGAKKLNKMLKNGGKLWKQEP